ncbi:MAG: muconolactone Delta-isomerase family protein [Chitinophagales bacterium]|nr:muconolactone Delta-isomerase family protein [Chitinophagales bacterium]
MRKTFMVEFDLPEHMDDDFMAMIPKQRYTINSMLAEGRIQSYALSLDRSKLWAIMRGDSEFDIMESIAQMPLSPYMTPHVSELMFHNSADALMHFSLN